MSTLFRLTQCRCMSNLSNRAKFRQIQPPRQIFEKLERLGFGSLRRTKRYEGVVRTLQKPEGPPDPEIKVSSFGYISYA